MTYLSYIACAIVFVSAFIPPNNYLIVSLLHLLTPVCLIYLALVGFALLILRRWYHLIVTALLLIVNIGNWAAFFQISKRSKTKEASIGVLSYNVGFFGIPPVFSKEYFDSASANKGNLIIEWIAQSEAPVVCIQEFYNDDESSHHNYLNKLSVFGYQTSILAVPNSKNRTLRGLVTCSKFPIVGRGEIFISDSRYNGASYTDLLMADDTVRIINVHLESMELYFGNKRSFRNKIKHFWSQYKSAMTTRIKQVKKLTDFISKSPYPVIVAGDFNETPYSYHHKLIRKQLTNAFENAGEGFGTTYPSAYIPIRIDHEYFGPQFSCDEFVVSQEVKLSNHFPIYAAYQLNN